MRCSQVNHPSQELTISITNVYGVMTTADVTSGTCLASVSNEERIWPRNNKPEWARCTCPGVDISLIPGHSERFYAQGSNDWDKSFYSVCLLSTLTFAITDRAVRVTREIAVMLKSVSPKVLTDRISSDWRNVELLYILLFGLTNFSVFTENVWQASKLFNIFGHVYWTIMA